MDPLTESEELLERKRRKAPATSTMPAKKAKVDNKKPIQKAKIDDEVKFKNARRRLKNEVIKLIENNKREDITKLYEDEIKEWECEQQDLLKDDMDVFKEYDFAIALSIAESNKDKFGYEYYYVKAVRMDPSFNTSCVGDAVKRKSETLEDMTKKLGHYKQYFKEPNNQVDQINTSRFYALVHNTVAIEGNEFKLDDVKRYLNTGELIPDRTSHDHDEVTDAASAIKFADERIIPNDSHITLETILDLHKKVMKTTNPDCCGELRKEQVFVGEHVPPKHDDVPELMSAFIESLNQKTDSHVIEVAAHVHNEFVRIHPFVDGNGRIGRLLMNIVLQRNGFPAIEIPLDRRQDYYNSIQMYDDGYHVAFVELIADCVGRALNEYLNP